jgi:hypothetical protein
MITPSDSPSAPELYSAVPVQDVNIQAPQQDLHAEFNAANDAAGAGVLYPQSDRQKQTEALLSSPQGFAVEGYDIDAGSAAQWPRNIEPGG